MGQIMRSLVSSLPVCLFIMRAARFKHSLLSVESAWLSVYADIQCICVHIFEAKYLENQEK